MTNEALDDSELAAEVPIASAQSASGIASGVHPLGFAAAHFIAADAEVAAPLAQLCRLRQAQRTAALDPQQLAASLDELGRRVRNVFAAEDEDGALLELTGVAAPRLWPQICRLRSEQAAIVATMERLSTDVRHRLPGALLALKLDLLIAAIAGQDKAETALVQESLCTDIGLAG